MQNLNSAVILDDSFWLDRAKESRKEATKEIPAYQVFAMQVFNLADEMGVDYNVFLKGITAVAAAALIDFSQKAGKDVDIQFLQDKFVGDMDVFIKSHLNGTNNDTTKE